MRRLHENYIQAVQNVVENYVGGSKKFGELSIVEISNLFSDKILKKYILGSKALKLKNISCIIDDNHLYHGKLWNNLIPIISFQDFKKIYKTKNIFLAMSDCYHKKVFKKLFDYRVYGLNL